MQIFIIFLLQDGISELCPYATQTMPNQHTQSPPAHLSAVFLHTWICLFPFVSVCSCVWIVFSSLCFYPWVIVCIYIYFCVSVCPYVCGRGTGWEERDASRVYYLCEAYGRKKESYGMLCVCEQMRWERCCVCVCVWLSFSLHRGVKSIFVGQGNVILGNLYCKISAGGWLATVSLNLVKSKPFA